MLEILGAAVVTTKEDSGPFNAEIDSPVIQRMDPPVSIHHFHINEGNIRTISPQALWACHRCQADLDYFIDRFNPVPHQLFTGGAEANRFNISRLHDVDAFELIDEAAPAAVSSPTSSPLM